MAPALEAARDVARDRALLGLLLERLGLPLSVASPLLAHASATAAAAERLGLVSPRDRWSVVRRHTADSLLFAVARAPLAGERWVDVGSGAGFPGLVLACAYPEAHFTLVEPKTRRAGFLELQTADLGLLNVSVHCGPVEEVDPGFDVAVARALERPERAILTLRSLLRPGGVGMVAASPAAPVPGGARLVRLETPERVDSSGLLLMMARD